MKKKVRENTFTFFGLASKRKFPSFRLQQTMLCAHQCVRSLKSCLFYTFSSKLSVFFRILTIDSFLLVSVLQASQIPFRHILVIVFFFWKLEFPIVPPLPRLYFSCDKSDRFWGKFLHFWCCFLQGFFSYPPLTWRHANMAHGTRFHPVSLFTAMSPPCFLWPPCLVPSFAWPYN